MRSADTDPEAEKIQLGLLRAASVAARVALACSLSATTLQLTRQAIQRAHPTADADELAVLFVAQCYGRELGDGLRRDLARRRLRHQL